MKKKIIYQKKENQSSKDRKWYVSKIFLFFLFLFILLATVLILQGLGEKTGLFCLSESVVKSLIGAIFTAFTGVVYTIMKHL